MIPQKVVPRFFVVMAAAAFATVWGHEGHGDNAPIDQSGAQSDIVYLSPEAKQSLDIKTADVTVLPIEKTIKASGVIQPLSGSRENITSTISGTVADVYVTLGQRLRSGDPLFSLTSRQISAAPVIIKVVAPRAGDAVKLNVIQGDAVEPGTPLMELADYSEVHAVAKVYESQIDRIRKGMIARVYLPGSKTDQFDSRVDLIGSEVDPQTRTVDVLLRVKNVDRRFKINMTVGVFFVAEKEAEAMVVPVSAVLSSGVEKFVYVVENGAYHRTPVVTGLENDRWIEITDGVAPGDVVVTQGNYQLQFAKSKAPAQGAKHVQ